MHWLRLYLFFALLSSSWASDSSTLSGSLENCGGGKGGVVRARCWQVISGEHGIMVLSTPTVTILISLGRSGVQRNAEKEGSSYRLFFLHLLLFCFIFRPPALCLTLLWFSLLYDISRFCLGYSREGTSVGLNNMFLICASFNGVNTNQ
jgi:hypothetical protein